MLTQPSRSTVSLLVEIPEDLHEALEKYLEIRPEWDQDRTFTAALSMLLLQSRTAEDDKHTQRQCSRIYLDTVFGGKRNG